MNEAAPVVTIDGPGGSGKGTLAASLAQRLGWWLLDSGSLYRILAWAALERQLELDDELALVKLIGELAIDFRNKKGVCLPLVNGRLLDNELRAERISEAASRVAALGAVRHTLLALQKAMRKAPGLVADGRDMGSVVFPAAELKIFLTASPEKRAERRYKQLKDKGLDGSLRALLGSIKERDERDQTREESPLIPAPDAIVLDSTEMTVDEVIDRVMALIHERKLHQTAG